MSPVVWVPTVLLAAFFLCGPRAYELPVLAFAKARQATYLWQEYQRLSLENAELKQLLKFFHTEEGKEVLLRGRYNMVRQGEYLVRVIEPQKPTVTRRHGLRAMIDGLRRKADQNLELLGAAWRLIHQSEAGRLVE
ncbi:MAG: hypothetical protein J7M26_05140 [Armatimonadetes bacterium]|nr:hypothetical protein [Armatimonadota bacterium]